MKTIIYYVIYCGAAVSSTHYESRSAAEKAAKLYTRISGYEWRVRMMVGTVATD